MADDERWSIGEVARRSGVPASTLRYYESVGVLPRAERLARRRVYDPGILVSLGVIRTARSVGLSLADIRGLLDAGDQDRVGVHLAALAERKLPEVHALIAEAQTMRTWMEAASRCRCDTLEECGLFAEPCAT